MVHYYQALAHWLFHFPSPIWLENDQTLSCYNLRMKLSLVKPHSYSTMAAISHDSTQSPFPPCGDIPVPSDAISVKRDSISIQDDAIPNCVASSWIPIPGLPRLDRGLGGSAGKASPSVACIEWGLEWSFMPGCMPPTPRTEFSQYLFMPYVLMRTEEGDDRESITTSCWRVTLFHLSLHLNATG